MDICELFSLYRNSRCSLQQPVGDVILICQSFPCLGLSGKKLLYVPELKKKKLSMGQLTSKVIGIVYDGDNCSNKNDLNELEFSKGVILRWAYWRLSIQSSFWTAQ